MLAVVEVDPHQPLGAVGQLDHAVEARQHRIEASRLQRRLARQLGARDPGREAEVVLDPRARPRLATGRPGLGDERPQPLRTGVHGGREAGGPGSEHDEVEALAVDLGAQTERPRHLGGRRVAHHLGRVHQHRRLRARDVEPRRASPRCRRRCRRRTSARAAGCARAGRAPRRRAASRAGAIRRMTPCPSASCHARRAISVRKTSSPNSGQRATMSRRPARSNTITSVGSTATQALIVGSPVNTAMSPMNVAGVGLRDVDVLARLAIDELDPARARSRRRARHGRPCS